MKILIATKNMAKFNTIKNMLDEVVGGECSYNNLLSYLEFKEKDENGSNLDRAIDKAVNAYEQIGDKFDAIIGIDDGIIINDIEYASVKEHLYDIMVGDNVLIGDKIYITRAYSVITSGGKQFSVYNKIPYIVRKKVDSIAKEGYQLNSVISMVDKECVLDEMSDNELNKYYLMYSIEDLRKLINFVGNGGMHND